MKMGNPKHEKFIKKGRIKLTNFIGFFTSVGRVVSVNKISDRTPGPTQLLSHFVQFRKISRTFEDASTYTAALQKPCHIEGRLGSRTRADESSSKHSQRVQILLMGSAIKANQHIRYTLFIQPRFDNTLTELAVSRHDKRRTIKNSSRLRKIWLRSRMHAVACSLLLGSYSSKGSSQSQSRQKNWCCPNGA